MAFNIVAMVLVGGRGSRLGRITKHTAKPAVSFGGKYKLIDFVLSNLTNSGLNQVGMITQYEPHELMEYIAHGSTWDLDVNQGGIAFLTPYTNRDGEMWQKGTAHAIKQHYHYIEQAKADHVLVLSGDHVYKMNYEALIDNHVNHDADMTICTFETTKEEASRFGILKTEDNVVKQFIEKPNTPISTTASMGIYIFKKDILYDLLHDADGLVDFGKDIIPFALEKGLSLRTYSFQGYFKDVGTVESLYQANMDLIDNPQFLKLHEYKDHPVYTKSSNLPPHHITNSGHVTQSLISDGCLILGTIKHSILSSNILVKEDSFIEDSIIFNNCKIGTSCKIKNVMLLPGSVVLANTSLDFDEITVVDNEFLWKLGDNDE